MEDKYNAMRIISGVSRKFRPDNFIKANIKIEIKIMNSPNQCYILFNYPPNFIKGTCGSRSGAKINSLESDKDDLGKVCVYENDKLIAEYEKYDKFFDEIISY